MSVLIPSTTSRIRDLSDAAKISAANVLYVDPDNGDDSSATRGRRDLPYATLTAADTASTSGDVIAPTPTTHEIAPDEVLGKDGVNWHAPGATISKTGVVSNDDPIPGIFDLTDKDVDILGFPTLHFAVTESEDDIAGVQTIYPIVIDGSSNVTLQIKTITGSVSLDLGDGLGSILQKSTHAGTVTGDFKSVNYLQNGGTLIGDFDDPSTFIQTGGTSTLRGSFNNATINGGTSYGAIERCGTFTEITGTLNIDITSAGTVSFAGGTVNANITASDSILISGGTVNVNGESCTDFNRTGTSGTAIVSIRAFGSLIIDCNSLSAITDIHPCKIENTTGKFVHFKGGTIICRSPAIFDRGVSGVLGSDAALFFGDVLGVKVVDLTLINPYIKCFDATHSCIRWLSEANGSCVLRIAGGATFFGGNTYVFGGTTGQRGCVFSFEGARTATLNGIVHSSQPTKNSFVSFNGAGTLVSDSSMNFA